MAECVLCRIFAVLFFILGNDDEQAVIAVGRPPPFSCIETRETPLTCTCSYIVSNKNDYCFKLVLLLVI